MIKICAIDLDGTLFDKNKVISQANIDAIKKAKEQGCKVVIATGRPFNGVKPVLETLDLLSDSDYVICYNGAVILNCKTHEIIFSTTIDMSALKVLYSASLELNTNIHAFLADETLITPKKNPYTDVESRINQIQDHEVDFTTLPENAKFIKIMLVDAKETLDAAEANINSEIFNTYSMVRSSDIFLEFLNKETDKGKALTRLAHYLNIDMKDTMAIGDAGNDLNMIIKSGVGVAMANGYEYIKNAADYITLDNEHSGVAHAIQKFILKTIN